MVTPGFYWIRDHTAATPRWEPAEWYSGWFTIGSEFAICMDEDIQQIEVGARIEAPESHDA